MRERTLADEADGHDVPGTWFLDTRCTLYSVSFLSFVDACDQCVELPKTPRQPIKSPSKGKKPEPAKQEPPFDYHEGSVHDVALKAHLQRAYELFKVFPSVVPCRCWCRPTNGGLGQTWVFHRDLGYFRPTSSRTSTRKILHGLGMVFGYARTARFLFAYWWVALGASGSSGSLVY